MGYSFMSRLKPGNGRFSLTGLAEWRVPYFRKLFQLGFFGVYVLKTMLPLSDLLKCEAASARGRGWYDWMIFYSLFPLYIECTILIDYLQLSNLETIKREAQIKSLRKLYTGSIKHSYIVERMLLNILDFRLVKWYFVETPE